MRIGVSQPSGCDEFRGFGGTLGSGPIDGVLKVADRMAATQDDKAQAT